MDPLWISPFRAYMQTLHTSAEFLLDQLRLYPKKVRSTRAATVAKGHRKGLASVLAKIGRKHIEIIRCPEGTTAVCTRSIQRFLHGF